MHQIVCRLGLCPRPHWGSLQHSPDPLTGLGGGAARGRGTREGKGREGRGKEGRERERERERKGKRKDWMRGEAGHPEIFRWIDAFG